MEFKSMLNPHAREESQEKGYKQTIDVYEDIVNPKTGELETKKTGEENFYEKMQAEKDSYELEKIIERYSIDLNEQHITQLNSEIVDMTRAPSDLLDAYAMVHKLQGLYDETTADFKNHFQNFGNFLASVQNGKIASDLQEIAAKTSKKNKDVEAIKIAAAKDEADRKAREEARAAELAAQQNAQPNYNEILGGNV